jgi:hypothetical protein
MCFVNCKRVEQLSFTPDKRIFPLQLNERQIKIILPSVCSSLLLPFLKRVKID